MKAKIFVTGLTFLFLFGCAALTLHQLTYDIVLNEVERPAEVKERYGEQKIFQTDEEGFKYVFEDEMIKILWLPTSSKVGFHITNKTNHSIRIIWDEAAYVDENGASHRVMHSGVKYADRDSPQPPSVIVRKGYITDVIIPTDYVTYYSSLGWSEQALFPESELGEGAQKLATQYIGKSFLILLPIQIENVTNDYIFTFKIENVLVDQKDVKTTSERQKPIQKPTVFKDEKKESIEKNKIVREEEKESIEKTEYVLVSFSKEIEVIIDKAEIRLEPNNESQMIARVKFGIKLQSIGKIGDWYKVNLPSSQEGVEISGYIHKFNVK